jgi:hypothetical protein
VALADARILTTKEYAKAFHDRAVEEAEEAERGGEEGLVDVPMGDGDDEDLMDETMGPDDG